MKMTMPISKNLVLISIFVILLLTTFIGDANLHSVVGHWTTIDDKTGKPLSIVHIYKKDGVIEAKVSKINPILGQKPSDKCKQCKGALHNKPILGMRIIWGMKRLDESNVWGNGRVLDPKSGHIYRGKMTLIDHGCKLNLRGYVGIPLFGRTETWLRANDKKCQFNSK